MAPLHLVDVRGELAYFRQEHRFNLLLVLDAREVVHSALQFLENLLLHVASIALTQRALQLLNCLAV